MKASFKMNAEGVRTRIAGLTGRAQFRLDQQVAKDSNFYAPQDTGSLINSVIPSAQSGHGLLEWNEIYARKQYYESPNKSKDKNPNASMKWFERAKAVSIKKWIRVAQNGFTN